MCSIRYVSFLKAVYHYTCVPCSYSSFRSSWKTIWTKKIQPPTNQPAKWMGEEEEERGRETLMLKTELEVNSRNKCNMETEIERYALAVIWLVFKEIIVRHTIPEIYITIHQVSNHAYALHRCQAYSSCSNGVCLCTSLVFLSRLFVSPSLSLSLSMCAVPFRPLLLFKIHSVCIFVLFVRIIVSNTCVLKGNIDWNEGLRACLKRKGVS